mgnify:CR=1 FL=1|tara:strand:+ start:1957 stop:2358 length:402 start_codon:yes stop_codon:yes gene_type:complete
MKKSQLRQIVRKIIKETLKEQVNPTSPDKPLKKPTVDKFGNPVSPVGSGPQPSGPCNLKAYTALSDAGYNNTNQSFDYVNQIWPLWITSPLAGSGGAVNLCNNVFLNPSIGNNIPSIYWSCCPNWQEIMTSTL